MSADLRERVAKALCLEREGDNQYWEAWLPEADAVLAELGLTQAEPVGDWVMVPREPTREMLGAGRAKARDGYTLEAAWEAMLAAAPDRGGA
jgi:hypothetical protein